MHDSSIPKYGGPGKTYQELWHGSGPDTNRGPGITYSGFSGRRGYGRVRASFCAAAPRADRIRVNGVKMATGGKLVRACRPFGRLADKIPSLLTARPAAWRGRSASPVAANFLPDIFHFLQQTVQLLLERGFHGLLFFHFSDLRSVLLFQPLQLTPLGGDLLGQPGQAIGARTANGARSAEGTG